MECVEEQEHVIQLLQHLLRRLVDNEVGRDASLGSHLESFAGEDAVQSGV